VTANQYAGYAAGQVVLTLQAGVIALNKNGPGEEFMCRAAAEARAGVCWLVATALLILTAQAHAAEIKVLSSNATKTLLEDIAPMFEKASGHKVTLGFGTSQQVAKRVESGEAVDLVVITPEAIDRLVKDGKVVARSNVEIARSLIGIAVRRSTPHPDIRTPEALKKTLLAAKSVTFSAPATGASSGVHTEKMFERLGIAAEMKAKYVLGDGSSTGPIVARGEAEMAIQQISALKPYSGVEIVGPLPDELQLVTILSAGIGAAGQSGGAVQELIRYFGTAEAKAVLAAKGLEPGKN
jgi:molybdate transport system substrate-binding protein